MKKQQGLTLLELLIGLVIASILLIMANATFGNAGIECKPDGARPGYVTRARIANAIGKLGEVNLKIQRFELMHNRFPVSLDELNLPTPTDPWGNEYVFLSFKDVNGNGPKRKYKSQVPVNRYFDVYSMGPDGKTATPMVSQPGCDDILVAGDGYYVGVAYWFND
jgi:general secretion pathway protein G